MALGRAVVVVMPASSFVGFRYVRAVGRTTAGYGYPLGSISWSASPRYSARWKRTVKSTCDQEQKTFSQKLTKGYTGVKKAFTLVRSRISKAPSVRHCCSLQSSSSYWEVTHTPSPADDRNVEATMTKGDHMAAKHIPRTPPPAEVPRRSRPLSATEPLL